MEITTTIEPSELVNNIESDEEAKEICCQILSTRRLEAPGYVPILDEIDDDIIWQYLWTKSKKLGSHRERLSEMLKKKQ